MKAMIVLLVVLVGVWAWRNGRRADPGQEARRHPARKAAPEAPQDMVCCPVCGVHLPRPDAVAGRQGSYCCQAHRQQAEG